MKQTLLALAFVVVAIAQPITTNSITLTAPPPKGIQQLSASLVGNAGNATYYYWVVTKYTSGNSTPSAAAIVINAPNTLNGSNYIRLNWSAESGATGYDVLRTTTAYLPGGAANIAVVANTSATTVNDQGSSLTSYTINTQGGAQTTCIINNITVASPVVVCSPLSWGSGGGPGTVTSVSFTGGIINVANPTTTPALTVSGTSGGIPFFDSASSWLSSGLLAANMPMIGGGAGVAPSTGTKSGNTNTYVTTTGPQTAGRCVEMDGSGNHIAAAAPCGTGSGVALVNAGPSGFVTVDNTAPTLPIIDVDSAIAVTKTGTNNMLGVNNFGGATSTAPMKVGTSDPATCGVGEFLYRSDLKLVKVCDVIDTWSLANLVLPNNTPYSIKNAIGTIIPAVNIDGSSILQVGAAGLNNIHLGPIAAAGVNVDLNAATTSLYANGTQRVIATAAGLQWITGTEPACAVGTRGLVVYTAGGAGVADTYRICRKDAADAYAYVALF